MRADPLIHDTLSRLVRYPDDTFPAALEARTALIAEACPDAAEDLAAFVAFAVEHPPEELEELYTRTFDNNAERALEVGWHVFGENYTRGAFMVRMRQLLKETGAEQTTELPDHLSHVLGIVARCDASYATELVEASVIPAVARVADELAKDSNPYEHVLRATLAVLALHAPLPAAGA